MRFNLLLGGLLASAMVVPVLAQQSPAPSASPPPAAQTTSPAPMAAGGQWRASKLIGLNVYNDQNEKLGDINEILLDQSGKPTGVVIGVGGFLGLGQHEILVTLDKLKFVNEPVRTTTTTTTAPAPAPTAAGDRATGTTTTTTRPARAASEKWYPDHAIMSGATKESLKSMPEFKYN
jgi:sporulation protein YlmC with PRC-barrel domain